VRLQNRAALMVQPHWLVLAADVVLIFSFLDHEEPNVTNPPTENDAGDPNRSLTPAAPPSNRRWDKVKEDIIQWLKPPDPSTNYNMALQARHTGTAKWFLDESGSTFNQWKKKPIGSLFWIHGMRKFVFLCFRPER
jgi:hypothetical protein